MLDLEDLPHNLVGMPWISKEKYLETQYSLLRREGMECLRHAVNFFRARPEDKDNEILCVYKKVSITRKEGEEGTRNIGGIILLTKLSLT